VAYFGRCSFVTVLCVLIGTTAGSAQAYEPGARLSPDHREVSASRDTGCTTPPARDGTTQDFVSPCYEPADIRRAYGLERVKGMGRGQTIVLVDAYGNTAAEEELDFFHDTFFPDLPRPNFRQLFPLGPPEEPNGGWAMESALDVQWAHAIAPLADIVLLAAPSSDDADLIGTLRAGIEMFPPGTVFSMSFGEDEDPNSPSNESWNEVLRAGALKGQSFFAASGDQGTAGTEAKGVPIAMSPASHPLVTAVGGTMLQQGYRWAPHSDVPIAPDGTNNPEYYNFPEAENRRETVWNESHAPAATGGGVSEIYPRPRWQRSVSKRIPGDGRGMPDVAWNAGVIGGVLVYIEAPEILELFGLDPGFHPIGGTSAASPQVAALTALLNEHQRRHRRPFVGHMTPILYEVGKGDRRRRAFRDIRPVDFGSATSGEMVDNTLFVAPSGELYVPPTAGEEVEPGPVPGYPVERGWDMTTGHGSLKARGFIREISKERTRRCRRGDRHGDRDDYSHLGCRVGARDRDEDRHRERPREDRHHEDD